MLHKKLHLEATAELPKIKRKCTALVNPGISPGSADIIPISNETSQRQIYACI